MYVRDTKSGIADLPGEEHGNAFSFTAVCDAGRRISWPVRRARYRPTGAGLGRRGPYSGGVLLGRAILSGRIARPPVSEGAATIAAAPVTCTPAPCVFPNSQASSGTQPADETPIVVNRIKPKHLLTGANDYNCASLQGYYATGNLGGTWVRSCGTALAGESGLGDPIVGYDLKNVAYRGGINSPDGGNTGVVVIDKSTNNGTTWSAPVVAVPNLLGGLADKPWLEIDTNAASPRKNTLYVSDTQFAPGRLGRSRFRSRTRPTAA